jgi:hypothetical protein
MCCELWLFETLEFSLFDRVDDALFLGVEVPVPLEEDSLRDL